MRTFSITSVGRLAVLLLLALTVRVAAADDADPPGRVARLSQIQGNVSLQPAGVQDWAAAVANRPLTTGDKLWADQDSRAELDVGSAVIRLGSSTGFSFLNLNDQTAQMQVTAGTVIVRVRDLQQTQTYEIDTPNAALSLTRAGQYRVEVNESGDTTVVKVSEGAAEATGGGQTFPVQAQQEVTLTGTDQLAADVNTLGAPDALDDWSMARDREAEESQSRRYVADDMAGYQDLDDNGQWEYAPDYGYVWTPTTVVAGWAPYRYGHWVWVSPWGWTWVDAAPWGFAPFHYGRWAYWNDRWCWVPGPHHIHPVYAPALVAWVGGPRANVSVSVGGGVGWFPLGPREVYVPGYHVSETYVRNVNVTNTTIVNNTYITNVYNNRITNIRYRNATAPNAVTAVPHNVFTSAQPVAGHMVRMDPNELAHVSASTAAPAIPPVRQSVLGAGRFVGRPPATLLNRPVVARTPPPAGPAPFTALQAAVRANGGRPVPRQELARLQPNTPGAQVRLVSPTAQPGRFGAFNRPGAPDRPSVQESAGMQGRPGDNRSFADRERALQNNTIPPSRFRNDRPPSAQQGRTYEPPAEQQAYRESPNGNGRERLNIPEQERSSGETGRSFNAPAQQPPRSNAPSPAEQNPQPYRQNQPQESGRDFRNDRAPAPQQQMPQPRTYAPRENLDRPATNYGRPQAETRQFEQPQRMNTPERAAPQPPPPPVRQQPPPQPAPQVHQPQPQPRAEPPRAQRPPQRDERDRR